jgi:hypothetical protein
MEYLVVSHMGGYYISNQDPKKITEFCEQFGDSDWIVLSWNEGHMMDALTDFFSSIKFNKEEIDIDRNAGITKQEAIDHVIYLYDNDKSLINCLYDDKNISVVEKKQLLNVSSKAKNSQILLIIESYSKEVIKVLKFTNNNN